MVEKKHCEKWTFETLLFHIGSRLEDAERRTADRFSAQEKAVAAALAAAEKAVNAALAAQEKAVSLAEGNAGLWRASANEWRGAMDDREGKFVKLGEYQLALIQLKEIKEALANATGRGEGWQSGWQLLLGVATLVSIAVAIYLGVR